MPETRRFLDPEKRVGLTTLYAKAFGTITTPHTTGTVQGTSVGAGYYDFASLDTGLDYTVQEEAVAATRAATDLVLSVLGGTAGVKAGCREAMNGRWQNLGTNTVSRWDNISVGDIPS